MDPFDSLLLPPDRVGRFKLTDPLSGQPIRNRETSEEAWIDLVGWHSDQAQQHRYDTELKLRDLGRSFTPAEHYENMGEMLARLTLRWNLVGRDGAPISVECTYSNAVALYNRLAFRPYRNALIDFLNQEGNFPLRGASDSSPGPDTSSD